MECHPFDIERDSSGWDAIAAASGRNLFQSSGLIAVHRFGRAHSQGLLIRKDGRTIAGIGGLVTGSKDARGFQSLSFPGFSQPQAPGVVSQLIESLRSLGFRRVAFGSFNGGVEEHAEECPGCTLSERLEFIYDLSADEDERYRWLNYNHRRQLKKSSAHGFSLGKVGHNQPWVMTRLHRDWANRRERGKRLQELFSDWFYFRRVTQRLVGGGGGTLYALRDAGGETLSFAFMLESAETAYYMMGASSNRGYRCGASVRLFWELARHYRDTPVRLLNFGGVPAGARDKAHDEHGVYRFKSGFGVDPVIRRSLVCDLNP